jgi:glycine dehydrogenase subunit 1
MRYIPHTPEDIAEMLSRIGIDSIEDLFVEIPESVRLNRSMDLPPPLAESELLRELRKLAGQNASVATHRSFLGGGAYNHFSPAAVDQLISRSEFYTAYTPYQPEISQGTLQAIFEFQTLICQLTGMDAANASMYDGASACAEAVLMSMRLTRRKKVLLSRALNPRYRETAATYSRYLDLQRLQLLPNRWRSACSSPLVNWAPISWSVTGRASVCRFPLAGHMSVSLPLARRA